MTLGERIRGRRRVLGLTQSSLAQALGLTPQHISVIEQDKRVPSLSSLEKLARELGVTIDYLVTGKEYVVTDSVAAIKVDTRLSSESKTALVTLIRELHELYESTKK